MSDQHLNAPPLTPHMVNWIDSLVPQEDSNPKADIEDIRIYLAKRQLINRIKLEFERQSREP